jgi:hypothetical protein
MILDESKHPCKDLRDLQGQEGAAVGLVAPPWGRRPFLQQKQGRPFRPFRPFRPKNRPGRYSAANIFSG